MTIFHNFALRIQIGGAKIVLKPNWNMFNKVQTDTQPAFTCSKLTIETLEQGVKYVQS